MKIVVSGSTGMIGAVLTAHLSQQGHDILRLIRSVPVPGSHDIRWNPASSDIDAAGFEPSDVVVHLSGENLAGKWTAEKKARIRDSRITTTRILCQALATMAHPPRLLISASATGYYGDSGAEPVTEDTAPGSGFLPDLCREWEAATGLVANKGVRVVNIRLGVVIRPSGGILEKLLPVFRKGLGGRLGSGRQYMSWVALDDAVLAVDHIVSHNDLRGPVNVVSPNPVTNEEFTIALAHALSRPASFAVPAFALKLAYGQMADETLLSSCRALPARLISSGFGFRYPTIDDALRHALRSQLESQVA